MSLTIELTSTEEARLSSAAQRTGLSPADLVKKLLSEHLPADSLTEESELDAKLRGWQEQDGVKLMPEVSAQSLFAKWAEEDASMTDEERDAEDRLWEKIEEGLAGHGRAFSPGVI